MTSAQDRLNKAKGSNATSNAVNAAVEAEKADKWIESGEEYERYESGYYWHDLNHSGLIYVSQKMVDKYNLNETPLDDAWRKEYLFVYGDDEDGIEGADELQKKYVQEIYIQHATHLTKTKDINSEDISPTPHGETHSDEFVAWWNDFPVELLKEAEEDCYVAGWCDGW